MLFLSSLFSVFQTPLVRMLLESLAYHHELRAQLITTREHTNISLLAILTVDLEICKIFKGALIPMPQPQTSQGLARALAELTPDGTALSKAARPGESLGFLGGALIVTYTILGVPYENYNIMGPRTLFSLLWPYITPLRLSGVWELKLTGGCGLFGAVWGC